MSDTISGQCVEVGDDEHGQPRLIIHTTREQLRALGSNMLFQDVWVTITPPEPASKEGK